MKTSDKVKFIKDREGYRYDAIRGEEYIKSISIHYNCYDHSNYYTVDGKQFNYLKDAKEYVKTNY
jgi:hypothetical protein